jgi:multiple sugar transport system permease protein
MKSRFSKSSSSEALAGYMFLLPNLIGFLVFTSLPVLAALVLSFTKWDMLSPPRFVGLANFVNLLGFHSEAGRLVANDPMFWKCLYNTAFLMMVIPVSMAGSLIVALAMNQ